MRSHSALSSSVPDGAGVDPERAQVETPFGNVVLTANESSLIGVAWGEVEEPAAPPRKGSVLRDAAEQLVSFARGDLREFDVPIDLGVTSGFYRRVLELLAREVRFGATVTYGELAKRLGKPGAARAVGTAMNRNPVPIFVPCHRVLSSSGIGGFGPGVSIKRDLLRHEGVSF